MKQQTEPCVACGEETSAGTPLFSDRHTDRTSTGAPRYLCSLCMAVARGSRELHSDEERARSREELEKAAFGFGSFVPGGH